MSRCKVTLDTCLIQLITMNATPSQFRIVRAGETWQFETEQSLEACVWIHIGSLLNLEALAQQYRIENQICDILALTPSRQLVILELKNGEDRYVVQQLTRYYDAIIRNQPFGDRVDYVQPIRLVAIAPEFHNENFIDQQYCKLDIDFLKVSVQEVEDSRCCSVILKNCVTQTVQQVKIPWPGNRVSDLPKPISTFDNILRKCSAPEQAGMIWLREKLLSYHSSMNEVREENSILYQKNKSSVCGELRFDPKRERAALFLYLPYRHGGQFGGRKKATGTFRVRIWTNWVTVQAVGHVNKGLGRKVLAEEIQLGCPEPMKKLVEEIAIASIGGSFKWRQEEFYALWKDLEWRKAALKKMAEDKKDFPFSNPHYKAGGAMKFHYYTESIQQPELANSLDSVTDLALQTWLKRF